MGQAFRGRKKRITSLMILENPKSGNTCFQTKPNIRYRREQFDQSLEDINHAIQLDPANANYYIGRSAILAEQGHQDQALSDCDEALRLDPQLSEAYSGRGCIWVRKSEFEKAISDFSEAIRFAPGDSGNYLWRAYAWQQQKEYPKAVDDYRTAIRIAPAVPENFNSLAYLQATCEDINYRDEVEAVKNATKACELSNWKDPGTLQVLITAYQAAGDFQDADKWQLKLEELSEIPIAQEHASLLEANSSDEDDPADASKPSAPPVKLSRDVIAQMEFRGEIVFPVDDVRVALANDPEIQLLSHPALKQQPLLDLIRQRLVDGYQRNGYREPEIAVQQDVITQRLIAEIAPGKRYRKGLVEIRNARKVSAETLEKWVKELRPPQGARPIKIQVGQEMVTHWYKANGGVAHLSSPLWTSGRFISFYPLDLDYMQMELLRCYESLGYFQAQVEIELQPEQNDSCVLVVTVKSEGEQSKLGEIEITGLGRNSREDLLDFLEIRSGTVVTESLRSTLSQKLYDCGKFLEYKYNFAPVDPETGSVNLVIDLYELEEAAPIKQPQPPVEMAAWRFANWLNQLDLVQEDILVELHMRHHFESDVPEWTTGSAPSKSPFFYKYRGLISPKNRLVQAEMVRTKGLNGPVQYAVAAKVDEHGVIATLPMRGEQFAIPRMSSQLIVNAIGTTFRPDSRGDTSRLMFGMGWKNRRKDNPEISTPLIFEIQVSPSFVLREFTRPENRFSIADNRAILVADWGRLELNLETGQLISVTAEPNDEKQLLIRVGHAEEIKWDAPDRMRIDSVGLMDEALELGKSLLTFLLHSVDPLWLACQSTPEALPERLQKSERGIEIAENILDAGVLAPLDKMIWMNLKKLNKAEEEAEFYIPPVGDDWMSRTSHLAFIYGHQLVAGLLSEDSWGTRITDDCLLVMGNRRRPESNQIFFAIEEYIRDYQLGPFARWVEANLFQFAFREKTTEVIAQHGLYHLSLAKLQSDLDQLLSANAPLTRMLEKLAQSIGATPEADWKTLVECLVPEELRPEVLEVGVLCRKHQGPPRDVFPDIIALLYPKLLKPVLREDLRKIAYPRGNYERHVEYEATDKSNEPEQELKTTFDTLWSLQQSEKSSPDKEAKTAFDFLAQPLK